MSIFDVLNKEIFWVSMKNICCEGHQEREILNLILSYRVHLTLANTSN